MARFFANRVVANKTTYAEVPAKLKLSVKEILINDGHSELVIE